MLLQAGSLLSGSRGSIPEFVPALEIEGAVASASRQMLGDRPAIALICKDAGVPIGDLQPALECSGDEKQPTCA